MRVWIDGVLLLDEWRNQLATFTKTRTLTAGSHDVKVEYFETNQGAVAQLSWTGGTTNAAPAPRIDTPVAGTTWKVGDTINFSGSATDAEDGTLDPSKLSWQMVLQHCPSACHSHELQSWTGVAGGSITAPDHEYPSYLELRLTAVDSKGLSTTVTRRLDPQTTTVTAASQPAGLQLALGSQTGAAPFTRTLIVGSTASLSAVSPQTVLGTTYTFGSWSDGGGQSHNITVGTTAATYTATYTASSSCPTGQYRAEYFANRTVSGTPARTLRVRAGDARPQLGERRPSGGRGATTSPLAGPASSRSPAGPPPSRRANDGMRVYVDGVAVVDRWTVTGTAA